jgi:hypothetical protein
VKKALSKPVEALFKTDDEAVVSVEGEVSDTSTSADTDTTAS